MVRELGGECVGVEYKVRRRWCGGRLIVDGEGDCCS